VKVRVDAGGNSYTSTGRFSVLKQGLGARKYTDIGAGLDQNLNQGEFEWADYEDDGDLDLLVAAQNRTTIYQNAGGDVFGKVNIGIPGVRNGSSADWGDYDGDGDLDIVVSGYSRKLGKKITRIYQNKGDGTFQWLKAGLTGVDRSTVKWGDYDSDGDLDLVVSGNNDQDTRITRIYRNDGTDFTPIGAGIEGLTSVALDWGDYDSDGDLDLILSGRDQGNANDRTILYRNEGDGTFTEVSTNLPGGLHGSVQWGDYNEDGRPDLLLVGGNVQEEVFRNEGSGVFTGIDAGLPNVEGRPDGRWGDADGDGDLDVVLSGVVSTGERTDVYRNEGDTAFVATKSGLVGMERSIVAWGDYDSDGDLDLAVGGRDKAARIYRSDGDASPWKPRGLTASGGVQQVDLDWTSSASEDLVRHRIYRSTSPIDSTGGPSNLTPIDSVTAPTTAYTDNSVTANTQYYYRVTAVDTAGLESGTSNQSDATPQASNLAITAFQAESAAPGTSIQIFGREFGTSPSANTVTFGDTEGTVLAASSTKLTVEVPSGETGVVDLSVTADGATVTSAQSFTVLAPTQGRRTYTDIGAGLDQNLNQGEFEWADFDDDGDLDLLAASKQKTTIYQNAGGDVFGKVNTGIIGVGNGASADWGDYDQDGDLDLVVSGYNGNVDSVVTRIYQNEGGGTFTWLQAGLPGVDRSAVKWGDYDQDGDLDLVVSGINEQDTRITRIYRNDGTDFTPIGAGLEGLLNVALDWGDYDSDGDLDLVLSGRDQGNANDRTILYRNDGGGSFTEVSANLPGGVFSTVQWGDYNEDGRPDLLLVGSNVQDDVFRNEGSGVFTGIDAGLPDVEGRPDGQWGDADGDGDLDVLIGGVATGELTDVYRNEGDTAFVATESGLIGTERSIVAWGDYDSDGDLDLAVGGRDKTARIYRSDGDGSPWPPRALSASARAANVNLSWTASPSEDGDVTGYNVYRSTSAIDSSAGPSGMTPVATVDTPATSYSDPNVEIGTEYHYRVAALDSADLESGFTAEVTTTPTNAPPRPPSALTAEETDDGAVLVSWAPVAAADLDEYRVYRDTAPIDTSVADRTAFATVSPPDTSVTDAAAVGQTYYYRVAAVDQAGKEGGSSEQGYAFLYPDSVQVDVTRSFDDASAANDYRLVALPGQVDRPLDATLSGEAGTAWQAWWDDGSDSDALVRHDGSETFTFRPGRGFWLTSRQDWTVTDSLSTVALEGDTSTTLAVNDGWTILSNPFGKAVDWSAVADANGADLQPLWAFGGAFDSTATFRPAETGTAYYFFNDTDQDSLTVPYPGAPAPSVRAKNDPDAAPLLALSATPARTDGPASTVRMSLVDAKSAEEALVAPPARFSTVSLRIEPTPDPTAAPSKSSPSHPLMASRRVASGNGTTFPVRLRSRTDGPVTLSVHNLQAVEGQAVALLDPSAGRSYDLRADETVTLRPEDESRSLDVAIGTRQYVKDQREAVLPDEVQLTAYPNPVRQQGTIEYALPDAAKVTLRVYDVLGRQVATLAHGRKEAGRHTVRLETDQLASGVYFGRLQAGDQTRTQKITLVR
jgi:fibronectin type 3 domain-containing protein